MRRHRIKDEDSHSYWQALADISFGLVLLLLLILMMFMIRILTYNTDKEGMHDYTNKVAADNGQSGEHPYDSEHLYDKLYDNPDHRENQKENDSNGGGGSTGEDGEDDQKEPEEESGDINAAVLVRVVDVDSQKNIEEGAIQFDLYNKGHLVKLTTHYPEEKTYRRYETSENGTFYLPEKIPEGEYGLKNITSATGYELASDVDFSVDESYDWKDPLIVTVFVGPEQNKIYMQLVNESGEPVHIDGKFKVYANEDIVTEDGTLRCSKNSLVDTIVCDKNGYGESKELYLGGYRIVTHFEEDYYAGNDQNIITLYSKQSDKGTATNDITCEKTTISMTVNDELYDTLLLSGIEYTLTNDETGDVKTATTNSSGSISFTDLSKNTTYILKQTKEIPFYYADKEQTSLYVDEHGYIKDQANYELAKTNRMIRITLDVVDVYTKRESVDEIVNVYDENQNLVTSYATTEDSKTIEGIEFGTYTVEVEGKNIYEQIEVENTAEIQNYRIMVKNNTFLYLLVIFVLTLAILIFFVVRLVYKRRRKGA